MTEAMVALEGSQAEPGKSSKIDKEVISRQVGGWLVYSNCCVGCAIHADFAECGT